MSSSHSNPPPHHLDTPSQATYFAPWLIHNQHLLTHGAGVSPHYMMPNTGIDPDFVYASIHHVTHTSPPTFEVAGTATDDVYRCQWLIGGVQCSESFVTFGELIKHLRDHDVKGSATRKVVCHWCTHTGSCGNQYRRDAYPRHIATHLNISYQCTAADCDKSFSRPDSLRAHMKRKHTIG